MQLLRERDIVIPLTRACRAIGVPLSTAKRHLRPKQKVTRERRRLPSHRSLSSTEREAVVDVLHSDRFIDQPPRQVYAELLEEGTYLASVRTMYRILAERKETRERRDQRAPKSHPAPRLVATRPNMVWTWDISKLPTFEAGTFLNLYLVIDLYSRFPVAWMVAERENSALSKQLLSEAISRYEIAPDSLTVHNDRGAPMTAVGFIDLLAELGAARSLSRPRVSNDNAFSEACFKTVKYQPDYPGRFRDVHDARSWCGEFFEWYANEHRHSGLALFTPADVFFGRWETLAIARQAALDAAYAAHPERFVRGRPIVARPPNEVAINPVEPETPTVTAADLLAGRQEMQIPPQPPTAVPELVLPGAVPAANLCS